MKKTISILNTFGLTAEYCRAQFVKLCYRRSIGLGRCFSNTFVRTVLDATQHVTSVFKNKINTLRRISHVFICFKPRDPAQQNCQIDMGFFSLNRFERYACDGFSKIPFGPSPKWHQSSVTNNNIPLHSFDTFLPKLFVYSCLYIDGPAIQGVISKTPHSTDSRFTSVNFHVVYSGFFCVRARFKNNTRASVNESNLFCASLRV